ncbi:unnamed protein product [Arabis nemorensis]|uniref:F-box domain-containing protein n=1 Tax=Arabis nemorensis TaxID=586526 RepID=A0A565C2T6_9BRAS|nr:unnamed protein product [Arabis nemorensis]
MASSSSMPPPPLVKDEQSRNWSELPPELTSSIMLRLGAFEILENAQKVCRPWQRVSKDPSLWRKISTDSLLNYIADRSSNLRSLGLEMSYPMTSNGLVNAVAKLPLLEVLELYETWQNLDLKAIGHSCLKLKTLKLNCSGSMPSQFKSDDDDALAIAKSMPELSHLRLIANRLTETGLNAILDNCLHLEHLDLRCCLNINLSRDLEKRCLERFR